LTRVDITFGDDEDQDLFVAARGTLLWGGGARDRHKFEKRKEERAASREKRVKERAASRYFRI